MKLIFYYDVCSQWSYFGDLTLDRLRVKYPSCLLYTSLDGLEELQADAAASSALVDDEAFERRAEAFDECLINQKGRPSNDAPAVGRHENLAPLS